MRILLVLVGMVCLLWGAKPELLLLESYEDQNISGWLMSEKLDGVRAYWDGKNLISRSGKIFASPAWFTKNFPSFALDGELWSKQGDFETIQSIVMRQKPHEGWKNLGYHIFDVPYAKGNLSQRLDMAKPYISSTLHIIPQQRCEDGAHAKRFLKEVEAKGGEGIVLRDPNAPYIPKHTSKALKLKTFYDAECEVVAHHEGEGRLAGHFGLLTCKANNGSLFNVGSGFSEKERQNPPKIGSTITYQYQEMTQNGMPRFPVFLRIREKE